LSTDYTAQALTRHWEYFNSVAKAPGVSDYQANFGNTTAIDEIHAVIVDRNGSFTGVPGTILEVFQGMSRATDAKTVDGATNYYKNIINQQSNYVWFLNHRAASEANTAVNLATSAFSAPMTLQFDGGADGDGESNVPMNILAQGYDQFASAESVDVSLVLQGKARGGQRGEQLANYIIDNVAETRKDCVAFVSPSRATVVNNIGDEVTDVVAFRNALHNSSYAFMDTGYKYQYDKYNDIYRYVPLNGDVAGLAVRTDSQRDPWFSPAGFNRGQIKNIIKLAYNPGKAERDILYKADVNPVVTFPGQGTVLFGDKTLLGKPSAFDRINVRRLFIVLEKAIATASKFTLFEFNDGFTRAQFKNLVEPFLRDVQGRRGIYEFKVVCDETNNTGEVIDSNRFVGDIYIKPARSINFIQLNFVAVRTGVQFSEVVGKF
jgi:phage tail sheath protein FI